MARTLFEQPTPRLYATGSSRPSLPLASYYCCSVLLLRLPPCTAAAICLLVPVRLQLLLLLVHGGSIHMPGINTYMNRGEQHTVNVLSAVPALLSPPNGRKCGLNVVSSPGSKLCPLRLTKSRLPLPTIFLQKNEIAVPGDTTKKNRCHSRGQHKLVTPPPGLRPHHRGAMSEHHHQRDTSHRLRRSS